MYIPIQLDKSRNILMGFQGLQLFKKITGCSLAKMDHEKEDMEDYVPTIIYCALVHEDKELTLEQTTELIDKHLGVKKSLEILEQILLETFGGDEEEIKNAQKVALQKMKSKKKK